MFLRTRYGSGISGNVVFSTRGQSSFMQITGDAAKKKVALTRFTVCLFDVRAGGLPEVACLCSWTGGPVLPTADTLLNVVRNIKQSITGWEIICGGC